jgi:hypothetical protein
MSVHLARHDSPCLRHLPQEPRRRSIAEWPARLTHRDSVTTTARRCARALLSTPPHRKISVDRSRRSGRRRRNDEAGAYRSLMDRVAQ